MKYRFDYTVESRVSNTVIIEAQDKYDACSQFDAMSEELIERNETELCNSSNFRMCDDPYYEEL